MSHAAVPPRSTAEPTYRRVREEVTPLSIHASREVDGSTDTAPLNTGRRASGAHRTSARRSSLTIPSDIPAEAEDQPKNAGRAGPPTLTRPAATLPSPKAVGGAQGPSPLAYVPRPAAAPVCQQLHLAEPTPQPQPKPQPAAATAAAPAQPTSRKTAVSPAAPRAMNATTQPAPKPAHADPSPHPVATTHMTYLRLTPRDGSPSRNAAVCTPQERNHIAAASVETLCAEKRRLERLSLALAEEIQSREFTEDMYALMPRGNQYYEAETCIRRIAGEAFDFSSSSQLQLALQMCQKNARSRQENSMFAGAMMSLTSLTHTGTAVESLENFNRFYAQRDTVMTEEWRAAYVTAMRHVVIGFQARPEAVLDQFGRHIARLLQHEQLYVALLRYSQGRPLESPAPNLDAEWSSDGESENEDDSSGSYDYSDESSVTSDDEDQVPAAAPRRGHDESPMTRGVPAAAHGSGARSSASPAAIRPSALPPPAVNTYNDTSGRPPSYSPRVNEANRRAHLTPVVGRGTEAVAASAAVHPHAGPVVFKPMPEATRRSSSAHAEGLGTTKMWNSRGHVDGDRGDNSSAGPYPTRGDSPEVQPLSRGVTPRPAAAPHSSSFVPPVPTRLPQSPAAALPPKPTPTSHRGSASFDAGYFRQSSLTGSLARSTDQGAFVLRNQEPFCRHPTPNRGSFSRENSGHGTVPIANTTRPANGPTAVAGSGAARPPSTSTPVAGLTATKTPAAKVNPPSARPTPRHATAPPAAATDSLDRPARSSAGRSPDAGGEGEGASTLPPTMSQRESREKAQVSRPSPQARAASADFDPAEKPSRGSGAALPLAPPRPSATQMAHDRPARAPSPRVSHPRGVTDEGSAIPGVPVSVYSQRAPSPQAGRASTPKRHDTR